MIKSYEFEYKNIEKLEKRDFKLVENAIKNDLLKTYFLNLLDIQAINVTLLDEIGINGNPYYRIDIIGSEKGILEFFSLIGYNHLKSLEDAEEHEVEFMIV